MATLWRPKGQQFFDNSGNPLNGGKFRFYDAGTLSAKTVYQDADEDVPWSQPITLDSAGRLTEAVYVTSGAFKENLKTSADVDLWTADEIPGSTVLTVSEFARPNMPVISKSVSYTVLEDDIGSVIQADATGGDITITLISAVSAGNGAQIGVQNVGTAGIVTVAVPGAQTINGATSIKLLKPRSGGVFTSNAGAWSGPVTAAPYTTLSKTTTYTVGVADVGRTIKCDASGGAFTVTLPAAADAGDGFEVTIIKTDSGTNLVTIDGDGSETINGAANVTISKRYQAVKLRCDGSNWFTLTDADAAGLGAYVVPVGSVVPYAGTTAPAGWLFCYGQAISRTTYAALFAALSTTYGVGDGSTTFNLPDLRGRVVAGKDDMGGTSANRLTDQSGGLNGDTLGDTGGSETHTLTTDEMPAHTHTVTSGNNSSAGGTVPYESVSTADNSFTTNSTGGGDPHNNTQPTIILNYIIKT